MCAEHVNTIKDFVDEKAYRMMKAMGYKTGCGLGKHEQGILNPINVAMQRGKCGFGQKFDCDEEINQSVQWLERTPSENGGLNLEVLVSWVVKGAPIKNLVNESHFCDPKLLDEILTAKGIFDQLDPNDLYKARARANPFETLRSMFFMNRAALKMANIDAATDHMFTNVDRNPHLKKTTGPYYFADVCAGPGGFTEYVLWRKQWSFKGFGFTLRNDNDFHLYNSVCASAVTFQPLYGLKNDGNVFCPENIADFARKVLNESEKLGVHFMMSDGGFSVEGNEEIQEVLSKQIYACQCLVALEIVRPNGHFVTKLFDIYTKFSVGLVFLMRRCFEKVSILKPNASRPANSERYLFCYGLQRTSEMLEIRKYLRALVHELWTLRQVNCDEGNDIVEIVPFELVKCDSDFYEYICASNNCIGRQQLRALLKLSVFCQNPLLVETRQPDFREQALINWGIPDKPKSPVQYSNLDSVLNTTVHDRDFMNAEPEEIYELNELERTDLRNWSYCLLNSSCTFFAGVGFSKAFKYNNNTWVKLKNLHLAPGTLLYGELVKEQTLVRETGDQTERFSLHVIDAIKLGDISLTDMCFNDRSRLVETYCEAVNHETRSGIRVRFKRTKPLVAFVGDSGMKNGANCELPVLGMCNKKETFRVNGLLLLKTDFSQDFQSTYVSRKYVALSEKDLMDERIVTLETFRDFVRNLFCVT